MLCLIHQLWELSELICCVDVNYGWPFKAGQGVTQGGPLSPKLFNILVDEVLCEWLCQMFGTNVACNSLDTHNAQGNWQFRLFLQMMTW